MNRTSVAFALTAILAVAGRGPASAAEDVVEHLKKVEMDRAAAIVKGDFSRFDQESADDYTLINVNGQVSDKARTMEMLKNGQIKLTANTLSDLKVRVYGDTAVVTGKSEAKGMIGGREIPGPVMFSRVYVKKDGRWRAVHFQQTAVRQP